MPKTTSHESSGKSSMNSSFTNDLNGANVNIGIDGFDYANADLNKLSNAELAKHKQAMERNFLNNQKKPGDEGFVYDLRRDFDAVEKIESGWDSD